MNRPLDSGSRKTTFYGLGLGPGDPELLTIKALRILRESPVIAIPRAGAQDGSVAEGIVKNIGKDKGRANLLDGKEILELILPMTKDKERLTEARRAASIKICASLAMGRDVAFITLGDPLFFSTFSYFIPLIREMSPTTAIEIVPGVSSTSAASAALNLALSESHESIAIIPAVYNKKELRRVLEDFDTVVLMKVNKVMDLVLGLLEELDLTDKARFISKASWPEEEIVTNVGALKGARLPYFSMMIVKK